MSTAGGPVPTTEIVLLAQRPLQALSTRELRILEEYFRATRKHAEEQLARIQGQLGNAPEPPVISYRRHGAEHFLTVPHGK